MVASAAARRRSPHESFLPAVDLTENDSQYAVSVELPGIERNEVRPEVHEGMLTVSGEKKSERDETKDRTRYVERSYGFFSRSFALPSNADADHLNASFKDGILTITIPKIERRSLPAIATGSTGNWCRSAASASRRSISRSMRRTSEAFVIRTAGRPWKNRPSSPLVVTTP